jgi:hypothetical protein
MTTTTLAFRRAARQTAKASVSTPVEVVAGSQAPKLAGESYYWATPGGTRIRYPSAFARRGWPAIYWPSDRRVEVGADWQP